MRHTIILCLTACLVWVLSACGRGDNVENLSQDQVYFFYQETCSHCHTAAEYIKEKHPNLKIKALDIKMPGNRRLFEQAARDYDLGAMVGTPLICFGKNYIMGWGDDAPGLFDKYSADYE